MRLKGKHKLTPEQRTAKRKRRRKMEKSMKLKRDKIISRKKQYNSLKKFGNETEARKHRSEEWFKNLYAIHDDLHDNYNRPFFRRYIPDVINGMYKYIIEIDGSWHDQEFVKKKDQIKDKFYKSHGFQVFRVKAYDLNSFNDVLTNIKKIRGDVV